MICPKCGSKNVTRELRPNGNDRCGNCHQVWPSANHETKPESRVPREFWIDIVDGYKGHLVCGEVYLTKVFDDLIHLREVLPESAKRGDVGVKQGEKPGFPIAEVANEGIAQMKRGVDADSAYIRGARWGFNCAIEMMKEKGES